VIPKEKRDRLFRNGKPFLRQLKIVDGSKYHKDIALLWVAHQRRPFYEMPASLTQAEFVNEIIDISKHTELLLADDKNREFKESGPVALIGVRSNGWKVEPHVEFFKWSTPRNILRVTVAFLQMIRYRKIGTCIIYSLEDSTNLFDRCIEYGVMQKVGRIPNGCPLGDEIVYSIRGKRKCQKPSGK